jgi:hypothetical protein
LTNDQPHSIINLTKQKEIKKMEYTITIEPIEMNHIKISSEIAPSRFYDMNNWTLGAAVENYVGTEIE